MKIRVFRSRKGDCLLITSDDDKRVLVDGGMSSSYNEHVAPALEELRENGKEIDVVYVSHIDQDHIGGVLKMADDLVAWRIFDFQDSQGNTNIKRPKVPRPPDWSKVWNNAFHDQLELNAGPIEEMLAARARAWTLVPGDAAREAAEECGEIAHSKAEAIRFSRRLGHRQLGIPVNPEFQGLLMMAGEASKTLQLGTLAFTLLGPSEDDLKALREKWNDWLKTQKAIDQIAKDRRKQEEDERRLEEASVREGLGGVLAQADVLGDRGEVTLPNLASLMFLLEEGSAPTKVLLTGDGHADDILKGLEKAGKLQPGGGLHVDVLKVQHHGSEHNWTEDFGRRITADNYVFCGNGSDENPDLDVVDAVLHSRFGPADKKSANPEVDDAFKVWFNCSSDTVSDSNRDHVQKLEAKLNAAMALHGGKVEGIFLKDRGSFEITL